MNSLDQQTLVNDLTPSNCIPTKECGEIPNYQISENEANLYFRKYELYLNDQLNVANPDVEYFVLPRCELSEMLKDVGPDADIKAHLGVKEFASNEGDTLQSIVLVFEDFKIDDEHRTGGYFDFTTPCPNYCAFE